MSPRPLLAAQRRQISGKKVSRLRRDGVLPAVVYGHGVPSETIQLDAHEFDLLRRRSGRNALLDLRVDGGRARPVLLHAVHEHPVQRRPLHADFLVVRMDEEMTVDVAIVFTGESEAVEKQEGTLLHLRETVQIRALPGDIPPGLEVDLAPLDSFDAVLHVSDLVIPSGVTLVTDPSEPLARVQPPRVEVEEVPEPTEEGAEPAEEGAEAAEGDAGAGGSGDSTES